MLRQLLRRFGEWAQRRILRELPRVNMFPGQIELVGGARVRAFLVAGDFLPNPVRRPISGMGATHPAVDRFVNGGIERCPFETHLRPHRGQEIPAQPLDAFDRHKGIFQQVGQGQVAVSPAQVDADGAESSGAEPLPRGQGFVRVVEMVCDLPDPIVSPRHLGEELLLAERELGVGSAVHVVNRVGDGGQATGEEGLGDRLRVGGQVGGDTEPTEALAEQGPLFDPQCAS